MMYVSPLPRKNTHKQNGAQNFSPVVTDRQLSGLLLRHVRIMFSWLFLVTRLKKPSGDIFAVCVHSCFALQYVHAPWSIHVCRSRYVFNICPSVFKTDLWNRKCLPPFPSLAGGSQLDSKDRLGFAQNLQRKVKPDLQGGVQFLLWLDMCGYVTINYILSILIHIHIAHLIHC